MANEMPVRSKRKIAVKVLVVLTTLFLGSISYFFAWISFAKAELELSIQMFPDSFTGNSEEVYEFTFECRANYQTNVTWYAIYPFGFNDSRNPRIMDLPKVMQVETEYVGKLVMPRFGTGECQITLTVSDLYNPNIKTYKIITVNCKPPINPSFVAWIEPSRINLPIAPLIYILRVGVASNTPQHFYLTIKNNYTWIRFLENEVVKEQYDLGKGSYITGAIVCTSGSLISIDITHVPANGEFYIEFLFYNDRNEKVSKILTVKVEKDVFLQHQVRQLMENVTRQEQQIRVLNESLERLGFEITVLLILLVVVIAILVITLLTVRGIKSARFS